MQPPRSTAGNPRSGPGQEPPERLDDDATPPPGAADSDEESWEALGSTRIVAGSASPTPVDPKSTQTVHPTKTRTLQDPADKGPVRLGDFELIRKIGEGAMGQVYLARQQSFNREVALKVLFPHIASNPKLVTRLEREGHAMFDLDHPNIVQAFGIGEEDGWHYVALEYVDGISMQQWLAKLRRLEIGDAINIIHTCAQALEYAHNQGVVHRDIKPDNVLISSTGQVKIADLGMVKKEDEDMGLTQTGHAVGTPWYMPLEQAKNAKETDRRSDIYALGCMLYCFLTGLPPFAGKTLLEVIQAKELGTFPPARQVNPEVPERLDLIIIKMTAKLPKYRYQSCAEVIKDLELLNMASKRLSFLDENAKTADKHAFAKPPSTHDDNRAVPIVDPDSWYVRVKGSDGRSTITKFTTIQVQKLIEQDVLPPNAKASHDPRTGFRALATYKEFQAQAFVKASRQSADQKSVRYRMLYKKIEERELEKSVEKPRAEFSYPWMPLAIKIGAGVVGFVVLILFIWWISHLGG